MVSSGLVDVRRTANRQLSLALLRCPIVAQAGAMPNLVSDRERRLGERGGHSQRA
jgi:hypothetical protein